MNQPFGFPDDDDFHANLTLNPNNLTFQEFLAEKNFEEEIQPFLVFEKLLFALFGVTGMIY